ncbi:hypothetical protein EXIGLDRAFT_784311 [Exidia glandulosa HHB12029]|uniref:Uncharacterized protein n=1 Tax=Exidia glandulosa HHB12029 TaxID=1314781 RepID=A0A166MJ72_EXIGL|nr:hypothetical protein EXIGLDRAFT_784311 [Exidia glandulosa HHB12029]
MSHVPASSTAPSSSNESTPSQGHRTLIIAVACATGVSLIMLTAAVTSKNAPGASRPYSPADPTTERIEDG